MTDNIYRDSAERYANDNEFHAVVDSLVNLALTRGYTPGELKQVAFYASFIAEREYPLRIRVTPCYYQSCSHDERVHITRPGDDGPTCEGCFANGRSLAHSAHDFVPRPRICGFSKQTMHCNHPEGFHVMTVGDGVVCEKCHDDGKPFSFRAHDFVE